LRNSTDAIPVIPFDGVRRGGVAAIRTAAAAIRAACLDSGFFYRRRVG